MADATDIQREIISLEKEKKNFARRINYKIKKLKGKLEGELDETDIPTDTPVDTGIDTGSPGPNLDDLEKAPQESKEKLSNTFEVGYDERNDYDIFFNNIWHPIAFSTLKPGDVCRVRQGDAVLKFHDEKFLTPVSYPTRNEKNQMVIRMEVFTPSEKPAQDS